MNPPEDKLSTYLRYSVSRGLCRIVVIGLIFVVGTRIFEPSAVANWPCTTQDDCRVLQGGFCFAGLCRGPNENLVRPLFPVAVAPFSDITPDGSEAELTQSLATTLRAMLVPTLFFDVLRADEAPTGAAAEGYQPRAIAFSDWSRAGAYAVIKGTVGVVPGNERVLDLYLYLVEEGRHVPLRHDRQLINHDNARSRLIRWVDDLLIHFTGRPGVMSTKIAFAVRPTPLGNKEIGLIELDTGKETLVTNSDDINVLPTFAPGDNQIAYTGYRRGTTHLYINEKPFSTYENLNMGAEWSPDGKLVAITLSKDENTEIYLLNGTNGEIYSRLTQNSAIDTSPTFSPDGKKLAFVSNRNGAPQIFVMNVDGSDVRCVTPGCSYCTSPDWHPFGSLIVYNAMVGNGQFDLFTVAVDSGAVRRLTNGPGTHEDPAWSPDGRYIVFAGSGRGGDRKKKQLFITDADGRHVVKISTTDGDYATPAWSPVVESDEPFQPIQTPSQRVSGNKEVTLR
ncbi:MAG: PD40 domain-containing protein [Myxococcales bacterium]|nr:PD40 domain-containing protein [Myxococcales bacterium]